MPLLLFPMFPKFPMIKNPHVTLEACVILIVFPSILVYI